MDIRRLPEQIYITIHFDISVRHMTKDLTYFNGISHDIGDQVEGSGHRTS
jgi:hypothetical protein